MEDRMEDRQLLRQFVEHNSQEAFSILTQRYTRLVYSVCHRELEDAETAEDVTQAVFLILARKAPHLSRRVVLSGWLFQTARFAARNARTRQARRMAAEQKRSELMSQEQSLDSEAWREIEPILNQSLAALRESERECLLLRYFQGLSHVEIGTALGLSEEAARKRLTRALEKMRRFFAKEGVIVPGVVLAALLSTHAAKAVPAACQANIAAITPHVLAGHLSLSLSGSHAYQLSEGVLKAMKIIQIKAAIGIATCLVIGFSVYAGARGMSPKTTTVRQVAPLTALPKLGHILVQAPGKTVTSAQIATHNRQAYAGLESYQGTSTVVTQARIGTDPTPHEYHSSANIQFVRPGKIHVEGKDASGQSFAYISDGTLTAEQNIAGKGAWKKASSTELAIAAVTGIAQNAATTIPALLLGTNWGNPFTPGFDPIVREDSIEWHPCYIVTSSLKTSTAALTGAFWIDEKTFLLRRYVSDSSIAATSFVIAGNKQDIPATQSHEDQTFTNVRLNEAIPDSVFTLPSTE